MAVGSLESNHTFRSVLMKMCTPISKMKVLFSRATMSIWKVPDNFRKVVTIISGNSDYLEPGFSYRLSDLVRVAVSFLCSAPARKNLTKRWYIWSNINASNLNLLSALGAWNVYLSDSSLLPQKYFWRFIKYINRNVCVLLLLFKHLSQICFMY